MTETQKIGPLMIRLDDRFCIILSDLEATVTHEAMRDWIRNRLTENDSLMYHDVKNLEWSGQVFADLWRRSGKRGKICDCITSACNELLQEVLTSGVSSVWNDDLLKLIRRTACIEMPSEAEAITLSASKLRREIAAAELTGKDVT